LFPAGVAANAPIGNKFSASGTPHKIHFLAPRHITPWAGACCKARPANGVSSLPQLVRFNLHSQR
jgi:hypothetical protein